jgi:hypothetical protein
MSERWDNLPAHLVAEPDARRTICGLSCRTRAAYPQLWSKHVPMHREGRARVGKVLVLCDVCEAGADAY